MTPSVNSKTKIPIQATVKSKKIKGITKRGENRSKLTKKIKKNNILGIKCPICLEFLCVDSVSTTICGHVFCTSCMKKALKEKFRCPICRKILRGAKATHHLYLDLNMCE